MPDYEALRTSLRNGPSIVGSGHEYEPDEDTGRVTPGWACLMAGCLVIGATLLSLAFMYYKHV